MKRMTILTGLGAMAYWLFVRPWHLRWGATDEEVAAALPGDENVPEPDTNTTRAVTIDAPLRDVWPWLVQLGQQRAGFYSYTQLENLVGCHMRNADRIVPEWQHIAPGDKVYLHPKVALNVVRVEPERTIVLERDWSFHLRAIDERTTRLVVRSRGVYEMPDLKLAPLNFLYWRGIFEPAHFVMERGMLLGIKKRAQQLAACERARVEDAAVPVI